jgi:hypothetical protein
MAQRCAFEHICLDYLGGAEKPLPEVLKTMGLDEAVKVFEAAFPEAKLTIEVEE